MNQLKYITSKLLSGATGYSCLQGDYTSSQTVAAKRRPHSLGKSLPLSPSILLNTVL